MHEMLTCSFVWFMQEEHVVMGICIVRDMELTLQLWAQLCSIMAWAVGLVMRWSVLMTQDGASLPPLLWLQQTFVHQILLCLTIMVVGATLLCSTLIWQNQHTSKLLNLKLELCLWHLEGNYSPQFGLFWSLKVLLIPLNPYRYEPYYIIEE